jgi:superoxide dismutase
MKILIILIFLQTCEASNATVSGLVQQFYCDKKSIDITYDKTTKHLEFVVDIIRKFHFCTSVELSSTSAEVKETNQKKEFNFVILENFESFGNFSLQISSFGFNFQGYFTFVFMKIQKTEIEKVFQFAWQHLILNLNLISTDNNNNFSVWTFHPFRDRKCGDTTPVLLKTDNFKLFPDKTKNLHKCPLRIPLFNYPPAVELSTSSTLTGIEGILLKTAKEVLNFTIEVVKMESSEKWGSEYFAFYLIETLVFIFKVNFMKTEAVQVQ